MKFRVSLLTVLLIAFVGSAIAQPPPPPPGEWPDCDGCYLHAYWAAPGGPLTPDNAECNYDSCGGDCNSIIASSVVDPAGDVVVISVGNRFVENRRKDIIIWIIGTGDPAAPPSLESIEGLHANGSSAVHLTRPPEVTWDGNTWMMKIVASIYPQPDEVLVVVRLGTNVFTDIWVWECCTNRSIPSMSQYGLMILVALLIVSTLWIVMRRRKRVTV